MKIKNILLITILLIIAYAIVKNGSVSYAQQLSLTKDEDIPSDLLLDLNLAQQNPAPEQKQIIESQTSKAEVKTTTGENTSIVPKDIVPTEIKTESATNAEHPDQTTSEQVISKAVTVEEKIGNQQGTPTNDALQPSNAPQPENNTNNNAGGNTIPGTAILEPDDNAANSGTMQNAPTETGNPQTTTQQAPGTQDIQQQVIPPENGQSNQDNQPPTNNPPSSDTNNAPNSSGSPDQSSGNNNPSDNSAVEGASTGPSLPWWERLFKKLLSN